jgi:hypothetical protein
MIAGAMFGTWMGLFDLVMGASPLGAAIFGVALAAFFGPTVIVVSRGVVGKAGFEPTTLRPEHGPAALRRPATTSDDRPAALTIAPEQGRRFRPA